MTMIQLIACIGMIAGLFMVLHVSPRELSDSLFARLTAAPGSIRADINETTRRKKAGFLRREITEAQAVLAASGRADKFPMVCFTSLLCFALGACIAIAAGNAFLVPVLAMSVPLADTVFAFFRRIVHGQSPFHADKGHFHHRLLAMGLNQKQAVAVLYAISAVLGLLAVLLAGKYTAVRIVCLVLAFAISICVWFFVLRRKPGTNVNAEQNDNENTDSE